MAHVEYHTRVLLGHSDQTKVTRTRGLEGKEADVGVTFQQHNRTPSLEVIKQVRGIGSAQWRSIATIGHLEKVMGEGQLRIKDQNNLVGVEPAEPLARVNGTQGTPIQVQSR